MTFERVMIVILLIAVIALTFSQGVVYEMANLAWAESNQATAAAGRALYLAGG